MIVRVVTTAGNEYEAVILGKDPAPVIERYTEFLEGAGRDVATRVLRFDLTDSSTLIMPSSSLSELVVEGTDVQHMQFAERVHTTEPQLTVEQELAQLKQREADRIASPETV